MFMQIQDFDTVRAFLVVMHMVINLKRVCIVFAYCFYCLSFIFYSFI